MQHRPSANPLDAPILPGPALSYLVASDLFPYHHQPLNNADAQWGLTAALASHAHLFRSIQWGSSPTNNRASDVQPQPGCSKLHAPCTHREREQAETCPALARRCRVCSTCHALLNLPASHQAYVLLGSPSSPHPPTPSAACSHASYEPLLTGAPRIPAMSASGQQPLRPKQLLDLQLE